jgi:hypothetical protein
LQTINSIDSPFHNPYEDYSPPLIDRQNSLTNNRHRTSSPSSIDKTTNDNQQDNSLELQTIQLEQSQKNAGFIERRRRTTLPLPSSSDTEEQSNEYPWLHFRTNSTSSFIQ